jgi:hypothetical protein
MIARLAVVGAALIVLGLVHVWGHGTVSLVGGAVLLAVAGVLLVFRHLGGPYRGGRYGRSTRPDGRFRR